MDYLIYGAFFGIPIIAIVFFILAWKNYSTAKKEIEVEPNKYTEEEIKNKKILFIISALIAGGLVSIVIGVCALFIMAIAFM